MVNFNAVSSKASASSVRSSGVGMALQSSPKLGHISARLIFSFIEHSLDAGRKQAWPTSADSWRGLIAVD